MSHTAKTGSVPMIATPIAVPVRLSIVGGSGQVDLDGTRLGQKGGLATVESPGFGDAKDRYEIEVVDGSKSVEIVART